MKLDEAARTSANWKDPVWRSCTRKTRFASLEDALAIATPGNSIYLCAHCTGLHITCSAGLDGPQVKATLVMRLQEGRKGLLDKYVRRIVDALNQGGDVQALRMQLGHMLGEYEVMRTRRRP